MGEVEQAEVLDGYPISSEHLMVFSKCRGVVVASVYYTPMGVTVRYCYVDNGKLVGFFIDAEWYWATGDKVYHPDIISEEMVEYLLDALDRVSMGLPVTDEEMLDTLNVI